ncbi:hypothetical protein [Undibacterium sp.]|jgi:hypothetical protein|uniref:hypothetical protein n=1 Tax=Undibacterium sp. TaxID=1914977 RepID=UPI002CB78D23|nr:hypothetical protein [Undibacterium sp.]HTD04003.1 hypothetical protein [Undibacterium sp.]
MNMRFVALNLLMCVVAGAVLAFFTPTRWVAASLWIFAVLFITNAAAIYDNGLSGGFDNLDGESPPPYVKGIGAVIFWLKSLAISMGAVLAGLFVQFDP